MYCLQKIFKKLDMFTNGIVEVITSSSSEEELLSYFMSMSFPELNEAVGDSLTWGEKNFLYQEAQKVLKENKMEEARILSRANPQLLNAVRLGISQSANQRGYDDLFGGRTSKFVKPGSVASMFSPAGYLTELYREARELHNQDSEHRLDKRRPDLASLTLSQQNMDEEISTLSLSNELVIKTIQDKKGKNYDEVMEMLSTDRFTSETPFHLPYEATRQSILLQDETFQAFRRNADVAAKVDPVSLMALKANIAPELMAILTEDITENNADTLIKKNFDNFDITALLSVPVLARYYNLTYDELAGMLNIITPDSGTAPEVRHYQNDYLVKLTGAELDHLECMLIKRVDYHAGTNCELIPLEENRFLFNHCYPEHSAKGLTIDVIAGPITVDSEHVTLVDRPDFDIHQGRPFSVMVEIPDKLIKTSLLNFSYSTGYYGGLIGFCIHNYSPAVFLLKLNKLIRLWKATGISPFDILSVIESESPDDALTINTAVLHKLFRVHDYMQYYNLDVSAALVLSGAEISQVNHGEKSSAFTQLFNTPPLNGQTFYDDGTTIVLKPGEDTDNFRTGVLKRAFRLNDAELYTLWSLVNGTSSPPALTCSLKNLSALYRVKLLAEVHRLTVTELALLVSVTPYATTNMLTARTEDFITLTSYLDQLSRWLRAQGWSVSDLWLMLTENYSPVRSPEMDNLLTTLRNGLAGKEITPESQYHLAAPFIAAATGLDSTDIAVSLLQWLDQLKPQEMSLATFLSLVMQGSVSTAEEQQLTAFCQVQAQLVLIVRSLKLTSAELSVAVRAPHTIQPTLTHLPHNLAVIRRLAFLHSWLHQCGTSATAVLDELEKTLLTPTRVARAMALDEQMVTQGMKQHEGRVDVIRDAEDLEAVLQWVDIATTLGITPDSVASLVKMRYSDPHSLPSWKQWEDISRTLQAGLDREQTEKLQARLDEALSAAVSAWVIKNAAPSWVTDRNALYGYLLLDNQVSVQIKTTRLAEAIASVQLYVNRTLNGQESDKVNNITRARQFFTDWDTYNRRYSTWAGVSQLVYYPENYVDPTMRVGQTEMMDEMLQSLSQSQLTRDSVEEAFKTYLTRFEEIANLDIISGYHDSVDNNEGLTYLVGHSAEDEKYYWRSLDHSKFAEGRFSANAWSEWKEIKTAVRPYNQQIRPVIFNSRLHLVWIEQKEMADAKGEKFFGWELKYAHILYDGTWGAVSTIKLDGYYDLADKLEDKHLYCSRHVDSESMVVIFYKPQADYGATFEVKGLTIDNYYQVSMNTLDNPSGQYDTLTEVKVSKLLSSFLSVHGGIESCTWGDDSLSILVGGKADGHDITTNNGSASLKINADVRVVYNGYAGTRSRYQVDLMKRFGSMKDGHYYLYRGLDKNPDWNTSGKLIYPVYWKHFSNSHYTNRCGLFVHRDSPSSGLRVSLPSSNLTLFSDDTSKAVVIWPAQESLNDEFNSSYIFIEDNKNNATDVRDVREISTEISNKDVIVTLASGNNTQSFNAETYIDKESLPDQRFEETVYRFTNLPFDVPLTAFSSGKAEVGIQFSAKAVDGRNLGSQSGSLILEQNHEAAGMSIIRGNNGAQYLQYDAYRTRLNTLFARQLVARANNGVDAVLSMETQQLPEPQPGEGSYVRVTFDRYDKSKHGNGSYHLYFVGFAHDFDSDGQHHRTKDLFASGRVSGAGETSLTVFLPYNTHSNKKDELDVIHIGVKYSDQDFTNDNNTMQRFKYDKDTNSFVAESGHETRGLRSQVLSGQTTEPMDFAGANALYFWEMFYYVPMMVFHRLKQEGKFTEATQWLKYIWSPEGYLVHGQPATWQWNVRPLEEDTSWNASPLDSVDPDAVAQADPMHYKVATFMGMLDLLIARGDTAYRRLERDTLNEAKMWYTQALSILGDEPWLLTENSWHCPRLDDAADQTTQHQAQQAMLAIRQQVEAGEVRTANSLTNLFLPQQNEQLHGYWQTLAQRLYNLRHNLSIDGMPLSLPVYATPADPAALQSAAVTNAQGGSDLPPAVMSMYRFPVILDSARGMVSQLIQFGSTLLGFSERQDAEALSELLQTQGAALAAQNVAMQEKTIASVDADRVALEETRRGVQHRLNHYTTLYEENVSSGERDSTNLLISAATLTYASTASFAVAAGLNLAPNIFGFACGGSEWGGVAQAVGTTQQSVASGLSLTSQAISQSEMYRRRREEWDIQRSNAEYEINQIDAQLDALNIRREAAVMQKAYLETQQAHIQAQLAFLQNKFSNRALYNWLRGKLSAIYYQFYDLTVSRCLMAQEAYRWTLDEKASFIRPGAWQGSYAGLMAGETLMLNLAQMEQSYLEKDTRAKEVTRTLCLSEIYARLNDGKQFALAEKVSALVTDGSGSAGTEVNGLKIDGNQLLATLKLSDLNITEDYPEGLGALRRIKQISVTLPALTGPYQDVRAVLSYGGGLTVPRGCEALAVSHGMNDSGQFQLDFNDNRWLPFEGIPVDDPGTLTLTFPDATNRQKALMLSLSDIILHIRYTIR